MTVFIGSENREIIWYWYLMLPWKSFMVLAFPFTKDRMLYGGHDACMLSKCDHKKLHCTYVRMYLPLLIMQDIKTDCVVIVH